MSNDIEYNLIFTAPQKVLLMQVKSYLEDKKNRWNNRGEKTAADLLKETGLKHGAEIVTWGFQFGKIQKTGDSFSVKVTSWANENHFGNIWISGPEGELHFLMEKFPELEINGSFVGSYGRGCVEGSELGYESWNDDESEDDEGSDDDEESQELTFVELDPEQWKAARAKNQALAPVLASDNAPGDVMEVVLPHDVAMQFCSIPPGSFTMGSPEDEEDRVPESENQVEVTFSQPFWLAKTEVTQAQWEAVMGSIPSHFKGQNLPVEAVSWNDAQAYIAKLNEGQILPNGWKFTLPTEAQWEYACRAGEKGPYAGGGLDEVGWYFENSENQTHEVALKKPNTWGLHDMHGNVAEWCADWFEDGSLNGGVNPIGPSSGEGRVSRGGAFSDCGSDCRAAYRRGDADTSVYYDIGFRLALVPSNEEEESDQDGVDETEEEAVTFADLKSELWEVANEKKQALEPALASVSEAGHVIEVALPQETVIQFCSIPAGSFTMGSPEDEEGRVDGEEDQAKVVLTKTFWLAKTPLTQRQWEAVVGTNPSEFKGPDLPVENVSWNEAQAFINKINEQEILPSGWKFALPSEAQWEYACRAGEHGSYSGGKMEEVGWCEENSAEQTHEVGQKKPNHWGLYDMHGNVWEWCADWYENRLKGGTDPAGPSSGIFRVRRGGAWCTTASFCRAARRFGNSPGLRGVMLGFRPALVPSR